MKKTNSFILGALIVIVSMLVSFGVVAGIAWLICWAFSIHYSLKVIFGVWLIYILLNGWVKAMKKE